MSDTIRGIRAGPFVLSTSRGSTDCIRLSSADGAVAVVSLHGAQVLSWVTADGRERLFLGALADFAASSAIRGGIPVIFPQFAARGPLVKHGFARTATWRFEGLDNHVAAAVFSLRDDDATRAQWPHRFLLRLLVTPAASTLEVVLEITNTGTTPFEFTCALHGYLRVDDLAHARLDGIGGATYIDSANGDATACEQDAPLAFDGEVDRIHVDSNDDKTLHDGHGALRIAMRGFNDTVVWNPGATLASRMTDLEPGEYRQFVCVEPARIAQPVRLAPHESWRGIQTLSALPMDTAANQQD